MLVNFGFLLIEIIFIYACLSTRPEIWCEVAGIAYSPVSATFGIIPAHLEMRDVRCLVSPSRAFCSSHLDNSLLLVEFIDF